MWRLPPPLQHGHQLTGTLASSLGHQSLGALRVQCHLAAAAAAAVTVTAVQVLHPLMPVPPAATRMVQTRIVRVCLCPLGATVPTAAAGNTAVAAATSAGIAAATTAAVTAMAAAVVGAGGGIDTTPMSATMNVVATIRPGQAVLFGQAGQAGLADPVDPAPLAVQSLVGRMPATLLAQRVAAQTRGGLLAILIDRGDPITLIRGVLTSMTTPTVTVTATATALATTDVDVIVTPVPLGLPLLHTGQHCRQLTAT